MRLKSLKFITATNEAINFQGIVLLIVQMRDLQVKF